jgi:TolB-like protein/class 3 adenylate cyclase/predicted Zn-dependent protease
MSSESPSELKFDIGHVLFIDIVGYSKLLIAEQTDQMQTLREIVRDTEQFKKADAEGKLLRLPTGDGGALVFRNSLEAPVLCALEISKALKSHPELKVRMGIHSGPVNEITDLNEQANIAGVGINLAQRVMDCGDADHILLSKRVADDLEQYPQWRSHLSDLGECEVKHGTRVSVVNLYTDEAGNRAAPQKFSKQPVPLSDSVPRRDSKFALIAGAALVLVIVGGGLWFLSRQKGSRSSASTGSSTSTSVVAAIPEKSIAVLPFDNLSDDKSNAYFAEGIQDEILTRLSKIAALKVISRTSTQKYKSAPDNLREVGQQLGVANLLEGSVQKAGNAVHINVQLIKAATDEHLWAESYDRELQNIFGVEGEVAGAIADQLNAKLSGNEKRELGARPTKNPDAYDAYLRGLAFEGGVENFAVSVRKSIEAFEDAVRLDPEFALAWARLSNAHSSLFFTSDKSPARRDAAKKTLDNAVRLAPDLLETQLAEAYYCYFVERDYDRARHIFEQIRVRSPNNSEAPRALALIARRQGRWDESLARFQEAIELDPRNLRALMWFADTHIALRQFPAALKLIDRALEIAPTERAAVARKAAIYGAMGRLEEADAVLAKNRVDPGDAILISTAATQLVLQHRYPAAIELLQSYLAKLSAAQGLDRGQGLLALAEVQRFAGDVANAKASYSQARELLEASSREQPANAFLASQVAAADAGLVNRDVAIKEAGQAMELMPASKDALFGPALEEAKARVLARFGEKDGAIAALQHLLTTPYGTNSPPITPALLRLDPSWDNLRGDPRFEKLSQEQTK